MNISRVYFDMPTCRSSNNMHIAIGKIGKGTNILNFPKEAYKPELAPNEAKTKEIATNGTSYIQMSY